jgi:large subunit ribosomal protein L10
MVATNKIKLVDELTEKLRTSRGVLFATHEGLSGNQAVMLRRFMRQKGLAFYVRKNTLSRIAMTNAGFAEGLPILSKSTAIIISDATPEAPFQAFFESIKDHEAMKVKGGIYDGRIIDAGQAQQIARLGTREQMLSTLLGTLNAPAANLVGVLQGIIRKFVGTLDAIKAQKPTS